MGGWTVKTARVLESRVNNRWQITLDFGSDKDAMRQFSDAYRTGQLVAVSDDAVERVARALCEASGEAWRSGEGLRYPFSQNARQLNNHWLYKAKAAIAAMKDTQPALAAKGTGDE